MYLFQARGVTLYADRWALHGRELIAASLSGGITAIKTFQASLSRSDLTDTNALLYDNSRPVHESPGLISIRALSQNNPTMDAATVADGRYRNVYAWVQTVLTTCYPVVAPEDDDELLADLFHSILTKQPESTLVSIKDWAQPILERTRQQGYVEELRCHNLKGLAINCRDEAFLQDNISDMVANGQLK